MEQTLSDIQAIINQAVKATDAFKPNTKHYIASILYLEGLKDGLKAAGYLLKDNTIVGRVLEDVTTERAK